jgi:hypothetical protein
MLNFFDVLSGGSTPGNWGSYREDRLMKGSRTR